MHPESATTSDFAQIRALLQRCGLPHDDLTPDVVRDFLVLRPADGAEGLVGCVGVERAGSAGLLRSLAVSSAHRGAGHGNALLLALQAHAAAAGIQELFLLTTTAADFFATRGYRLFPRNDVPEAIRLTAEFASICPDSATCMFRELVLTTRSSVSA